MEKNNGKIIAVAALVVAVIGLSVGFAAFAATLTIENISASFTATDQFSSNVNYDNEVTPTCFAGDSSSSAAVVGTYNAGTTNGKQWTGVSVPITMTQKQVTCHATIENESTYVAALNQISIGGSIQCVSTAASGTDGYATNASAICSDVQVTVAVDGASKTFHNGDLTALTNISGSSISANNTADVTMTINYNSNVSPDGDVSITVPTISLKYVSAAAQ